MHSSWTFNTLLKSFKSSLVVPTKASRDKSTAKLSKKTIRSCWVWKSNMRTILNSELTTNLIWLRNNNKISLVIVLWKYKSLMTPLLSIIGFNQLLYLLNLTFPHSLRSLLLKIKANVVHVGRLRPQEFYKVRWWY